MWLLSKSNELLARLEIDDLDVILREKKGFVNLDNLNEPMEQLRQFATCRQKECGARTAQDDLEDTHRERPS